MDRLSEHFDIYVYYQERKTARANTNTAPAPTNSPELGVLYDGKALVGEPPSLKAEFNEEVKR
ncbi:hypothetical protein EG328_011284 [Venturia inaequalis]|uniref:Uncharacterized protein n=1 Tax=Venturia inaequalis TaxID=5025 RepID=A0A8H3U644_VENIN|nr:hypothetical protein EG328_011284 [Venturia inaequalis]